MRNRLFWWRRFAEHQSSMLWSFSENTHNSRTTWYIWIRFCILICFILPSLWHAKRCRGFAKHHFGRSWSFSENDHNSWTARYIVIKVCICMYDIDCRKLTCVTAFFDRRCFAEHQSSRSWPVCENAHNSWTTRCIWIKLHACFFNIVQRLLCKTVTRLGFPYFTITICFVCKIWLTFVHVWRCFSI